MTIAADGNTIEELTRGLLGTGDGNPGESEEHHEEPSGEEHERPDTDEHDATEDDGEQDGEHGNADDATDAEPEPEPEGDTRDDAETDEPSTEPEYTVTVDGKATRVTLKEALAGYQRNADYTRKTQEIAESRRALDAGLQEARGQRDRYAQTLEALQKHLSDADSGRTPEQWAELRSKDPAGYAAAWTDHQRRQEAKQTVKAEQDRVAEEKRQDALKVLATHVQGEREKLVAYLPVLKDPKKGAAALKAIRDYAVETGGFSEQEANQAYDHRILILADKARKWDSHQAALTKAKGKIQSAKPMPEPSARRPAQEPRDKQRAAQERQFERTGKAEDALPLLLVPTRKGNKG